MQMDIAWVRVYQEDTQGETRGLNPPITFETRRRLLSNRVTCALIPELRCMVKNGGPPQNEVALARIACDKLRSLGDPFCDYIPKLCSLNNAGNPVGVYGMSNVTVAQLANQRLSLNYGHCCIEEDRSVGAVDKPSCRSTPHTKLPQWLLDSEYYQEPAAVFAEEGSASGLPGTNPSGWRTYGRGFPPYPLVADPL